MWFLVVRALKEELKEHGLSTAEQIIKVVTAIWDSATFHELQSVFANWTQRLTWVIAETGEYYTK
jgi:hypothetical protein